MAEKLKSSDAKQVKKNDNGKLQADEPQKIATRRWNSKILASEWWEPAPDGFCSSLGRRRPLKRKP
jgi:hypothetical protein